MDERKRNKVYNKVISDLYTMIKDAAEKYDLTYYEIIGLLERLNQHFVTNTAIGITDIMIRYNMRRSKKDGSV